MEIEIYQPSQVGETDAANPTNAADSSTTISDNNNADSTTGWKWMWPNVKIPEGKETSILLDVKTDVIQEIKNRLGNKNLELFHESCFGAYLKYPRNQVPGTVIYLMLSQQVIKEGANKDELWFLVGDKFVRFSKYEYVLFTCLRFGPTNFDPNADCDIPTDGYIGNLSTPTTNFQKRARSIHLFWICSRNLLRISKDHVKAYSKLPRSG
ncbi:hypothetical protein CASFOL_007614 [Castilleja foliolosa]|uniref:DUF1985 domain-containing protein n=1 Tax=Castilleja foliolosa TaxID=1961234 RepID=A0ABD3E532_9LAMI